jgi:hypothetical protein
LLTDDGSHDRVTGTLTSLGPVDFTLDAAPGVAVSPVCGCKKIRHRKDWGGVTFAARSVQISRESERQEGTYVITAANPEYAHWNPGDLFFSAEILNFERTHEPGSRARFDAAAVPRGAEQPGWRLVSERRLPPLEEVHLTTSKPLNVGMLGPTPVGAWVPSSDGRGHLAFTKGLTANARVQAELTETDPHQSKMGVLSHPLADFLGPNVVIWSHGRPALETKHDVLQRPDGSNSSKTVSVVWIKYPPFATRIAAMPALLSTRITKGKVRAMIEPEATSGPYRLRLTGRPLSTHDYGRIQARFRSRNIFTLRNLTGWFVDRHPFGGPYVPECHEGVCTVDVVKTIQQGKKIPFRYPPKPPAEQGFTVFGPLRSLHLEQAKGALSTGARMITPTDLTLHDVNLLEPSAGALPVPANEQGYELDLSAAANGRVAAAALVTGESFREKISFWLYIVTALAAVVSVYLTGVAYFNRRSGSSAS